MTAGRLVDVFQSIRSHWASRTAEFPLLWYTFPRAPVVPPQVRYLDPNMAPTPVPPYLRRYDWSPKDSPHAKCTVLPQVHRLHVARAVHAQPRTNPISNVVTGHLAEPGCRKHAWHVARGGLEEVDGRRCPSRRGGEFRRIFSQIDQGGFHSSGFDGVEPVFPHFG